MKKLGFLALLALGLTAYSLCFGSVPPAGKDIGDTAIDQSNSEIVAPHPGRLTFEQDLKNLNEMERRYRERLPRLADRPELSSPMKRISARKYRATQRPGQAASVRKVNVVRPAAKSKSSAKGKPSRVAQPQARERSKARD